jgi:hypothetical protein
VRDDAIKVCLDPPRVGPPVALAHEAGESAERPGCTDREIRAARYAQPQPSHVGTIAGWTVVGIVSDIVVTVVAFVAVAANTRDLNDMITRILR